MFKNIVVFADTIKNDRFLSGFKQCIVLLALLNWLFISLHISNMVPLLLLGACGLFCYVLPGRVRVSWFTWIFIAFWVYHVGCDIFLFPDTDNKYVYRHMLLAFLAGSALFYVFKNDRPLFTLPFCLTTMLAFVGVMAWYYLLGDPAKLYLSYRLKFLSVHPNIFAHYLATCVITASVALLFYTRTELRTAAGAFSGKFWQGLHMALSSPVFLLVVIGGGFALIWATDSRSAFYATMLLCAGLGLIRLCKKIRPSRVLFALLGSGAILALVLVGLGRSELMNSSRMFEPFRKAPWNDTTFVWRTAGWQSAWWAFKQNPVFGNGPRSFPALNKTYIRENYDRLAEEYGEGVIAGDTLRWPHPHNMYLLEMTESGLIGLVLLCALLFAPMLYGLRKRRLYGVTVPLLAYYALAGITAVPLTNIRFMALTVAFMLFGYFAAARGGDRFE